MTQAAIADESDLIVVSNGDGATTAFSYNYWVDEQDELVVLLRDASGNDTLQTLDTHYTISGEGSAALTITFTTAPAATEQVVRYRATEHKQTVDLANDERNEAESVEDQLDRTIRALQDMGARMNRAFLARPGSEGSAFPEPATEKILGWNTAGTALENKTLVAPDAVEIKDEDDMASDSATAVPSQQSTKAYADTKAAKDQNLSDLDDADTALSNLGGGAAGIAAFKATATEDIRNQLDTPVYVSTRTALKALDVTKDQVAILTEGAGEAYGRFGRFFLGDYTDWSSVVTVDTLEGYVIRSTNDTDKVWIRDCAYLIPQHFGATAGGSSGGGNDAPALEAFYEVCLTARKNGYLPATVNSYYCTEQVAWDMGTRTSGAPDIFGGGEYATRIEFASGVTSPNFKISAPTESAIFYHHFGNFGVIGNTSGIVFQVGEDDYGDALNGCEIRPVRVLNNNQTSGCESARLNWLLRSLIYIGCNGAGLNPGDSEPYDGTIALHPRRLQDCAVWGAVGGADIGFLFDTANQYGNTFNNFNHETLGTAIQVTASIRDNAWRGGMAAIISDSYLDATAGVNNVIDGVNFAASVTNTIKNITATDSTWGGLGFSIINKIETSIHTFPSLSTTGSGNWTRNAGGQPVMVSLFGGTVSAVSIRRVPSAGAGNQVANSSGVNFIVMPGEEWSVTYSGLPNQQVRVVG